MRQDVGDIEEHEDWRDGSVAMGPCCFAENSGLISSSHNHLYLKFQVVWCPFLTSMSAKHTWYIHAGKTLTPPIKQIYLKYIFLKTFMQLNFKRLNVQNPSSSLALPDVVLDASRHGRERSKKITSWKIKYTTSVQPPVITTYFQAPVPKKVMLPISHSQALLLERPSPFYSTFQKQASCTETPAKLTHDHSDNEYGGGCGRESDFSQDSEGYHRTRGN